MMKRNLLFIIVLWLTWPTHVITESSEYFIEEEADKEERDEVRDFDSRWFSVGNDYVTDEAEEAEVEDKQEGEVTNHVFHSWFQGNDYVIDEAEGEQVEEEEEVKEHVSNCQNEERKALTQHHEEYHLFHGRRYRSQYMTFYSCICSNVVLTGKPIEIIRKRSNSVESITFTNSSIPLIPVDIFKSFTHLTKLRLDNNFINYIHPGAFTGLTKLKELYLQDNNITKIFQGILNLLPDLIILNLSNNSMEVIEQNAFLGLFALQEIYLSNNKLKELLPDTFDKLTSLNRLDVSYNFLNGIPSNLFSNLIFQSDFNCVLSNNNFTSINFENFPITLKFLILGNNHIDFIENWSHLQNIADLDLSNNVLRNIDVLHDSLMYFNLSGNKIEEINGSVFNQSKMLSSLDLSYNLLNNIKEDTFISLHRLGELYLQNNHMNYTPIGCFRDLQSLYLLNLSSNEITEFEYGTFSGLTALAILDISGNKLAYLYESSFHDLKNLNVLNIKDNLITSFDPHDLFDHAKHMQTVNLDNNLWVCKSLSNIIKTLEKNNVTVVKGSTQKHTEHVHGIACVNDDFNPPERETESENSSLSTINTISSEIRAFKKFLDKDFLNSSFYKYFETFKKPNSTQDFNVIVSRAFLQYFDYGFKNTTFFRYFEKDFSNRSFFHRFEETSRKLSKSLTLLDDYFKNSGLFKFVNTANIGQNISKQFDDGFKTSGFYKYFNKDFTNTEFFKYFDKAFQTKIDSNLLKIRDYFDSDFKNSRFYSFFKETHTSLFNSNFLNHSNQAAKFSNLTDNTPQILGEDFISKISELTGTIKAQENAMQSARTASAIFMTIIITVLLVITFLLGYNHIRQNLKENACKSVSKTGGCRMHIADAEMELVGI